MNKILLIIQREYLSRVKKKSFIIMTFLGPILMGGVLAGSIYFSTLDNEVRKILVKDEIGITRGKLKDDKNIKFIMTEGDLEMVKKDVIKNEYYGLLYIPPISDPKVLQDKIQFLSKQQPSLTMLSKMTNEIERELNNQLYLSEGIDPEKLKRIKSNVNIQTRNLENKETSSEATTAVGFVGGLLIYLFIFLYGAQVMRGVMEEKMSRIVEVIVSSVKPFELMLGKIIGIAMVGLTQFILWIGLTFGVTTVVSSIMMKDKIDQVTRTVPMNGALDANIDDVVKKNTSEDKIDKMLANIPVTKVLICFLIYFLGGYLLYGALFAAIGAAVDSETDTQQFMIPITIPLILSYIVSANIINNPHGPLAFWFSIIPFTSPIVMMVRLPFEVPVWQIVLSISLLIIGFIFTTWLAGKIYRTGVLMYGKKVNYKELWKWIKYS